MKRKALLLQTLLLAGGTIFSWTVLLGNFRNFYDIYGSFFRFRDCILPNPFVTPCFYGSVAFIVALIWSINVLRSGSLTSQRWLRWFLLFGTVFAFSVTGYEAGQYYHILGGPSLGCTATAVPPYRTPCLYGGLFYLSAFLTSVMIVRRARSGLSTM